MYDNTTPLHTNSQPYVIIRNVLSDGRPADSTWYNGTSAWNHLPLSLRLPYGQQDIGFEFQGINLKDPESVSYRYRLEGQDTGFSPLTRQSLIRYRNLEPGNYVFHVRAFAADGSPSSNTASFPFSIQTPFIKTMAFRLLLLLVLLLAGVGIQRYLTWRKVKKRQELERIRKEEQSVIRQKTAEDFHDEMGNKLTRITVLADILDKKMGNSDEQQSKLVRQIKDNAAQLYSGTRDILWTLDPGNDNLFETCRRIREIGNELFQYTSIRFDCAEPPPAYRNISFPIDYSRNLIMVLKEGMTNVLKHAGATIVLLIVEDAGDNTVIFSLSDNGHGFDTAGAQKGKGLHNIRNRVGRIHADLSLTSSPAGTTLTLKVKCP